MKAKHFILTLALAFAGAATALAQSPQMGTWKLNEAKSHIPTGSIKNTNVTYEAAGDDIKVTTEGFAPDGAPMHTDWTGKFDGKPYPLTGDPTADTRAYTKVNDHTLTLVNGRPGKASTTGRIVVSPDGKTRTLTTHSTSPAGKKISGTAIYEKQ